MPPQLPLSPQSSSQSAFLRNASINESNYRVRTEIIKIMQQCNERQQTNLPSSSTQGTDNVHHANDHCLINRFIRACPPLVDPNWAMQQLMWISNNNASFWNKSVLPSSVWAPPGTPQCPFGTRPTDFV